MGPAWVPNSPEPDRGFVLTAGRRHKQVLAFKGAAQAAATALGDDALKNSPNARSRGPSGPAAPYQKAAAQRAAERSLVPWSPLTGLGERKGMEGLLVRGAGCL